MDFDFVTGRLATGAALESPSDVEALVAAGITHVIDCCNEFDDAVVLGSHPRLSYLWNGTADDGQAKDASWFAPSIEFSLGALTHPRARVYAHCQSGHNRGPSTIYAVLRALGLPCELAERLVRSARPAVHLRYAADADRAVAELGYD